MEFQAVQAVAVTSEVEKSVEQKSPAMMQLVRRMRQSGYPRTAGVIVGMAAILDEEYIPALVDLLKKEWG